MANNKLSTEERSRKMRSFIDCNPNTGAKLKGASHANWKGYGEISGSKWNAVKKHLVRENRTIEFNITIEYAWNLFLLQNRKCALTGIELVFHLKKRKADDPQTTASLDRIDSSKGYIEGNVQWVHQHINIMKHHYSQEEFISMCNLVAKRHPAEHKFAFDCCQHNKNK